MCIAYCSEQNTDGRVDGPMLELVGFLAGVTAPEESAGRLVKANLFEIDADGWRIHDYLGFQPSSAQRNHISQARSDAGKRGGRTSGERRKKGQQTGQANGKQLAEPGLPIFGTPSSPVQSSPMTRSTSHLVCSAGPEIGSVTDGFAQTTDGRITATFEAWLNRQAEAQGIPEGRRRKGYIQSGQRTLDQHWPALKALAKANPSASPEALAELYRKPAS